MPLLTPTTVLRYVADLRIGHVNDGNDNDVTVDDNDN